MGILLPQLWLSLSLMAPVSGSEPLLIWRTDQTLIPHLGPRAGRPTLSETAIRKACAPLNPQSSPGRVLALTLDHQRCYRLDADHPMLTTRVLGGAGNAATAIYDGPILLYPQRGLACTIGQCPILGTLPDQAIAPASSVPPPPPVVIDSFDGSAGTISNGDTVTLSWSAQGVSNCLLGPQTQTPDSVPAAGSVTRTPSSTTLYELDCSGPAGNDQAQVLVVVKPPPSAAIISSFAASPPKILTGQAAVLSWISTGHTCAVNGVASDLKSSGQLLVRPSSNRTYTLTCDDAGGSATRRRTVLVSPTAQSVSIDSFTATPSLIAKGNVVRFDWQSSNADTCELQGNANKWRLKLATNGALKLAPSVNGRFTLTCSNAKTQDSESRDVSVGSEMSKPTVTRFRSSAVRSIGPAIADIEWESQDASGCSLRRNLDNFSPIPLDGIKMVQVDETTTFTASCISSAGQSTRLTTIEVVDETLFVGGFEG
ncbi:MAG: hypothetical protein AB8B96_12315 [Lysobacterales bacterium]